MTRVETDIPAGLYGIKELWLNYSLTGQRQLNLCTGEQVQFLESELMMFNLLSLPFPAGLTMTKQ